MGRGNAQEKGVLELLPPAGKLCCASVCLTAGGWSRDSGRARGCSSAWSPNAGAESDTQARVFKCEQRQHVCTPGERAAEAGGPSHDRGGRSTSNAPLVTRAAMARQQKFSTGSMQPVTARLLSCLAAAVSLTKEFESTPFEWAALLKALGEKVS